MNPARPAGSPDGEPDRTAALRSYRALAAGYDASCKNILDIRAMAIHLLQLRPGEVVFDVACGTGPTLPVLSSLVGPAGRVIGIEQSPEMAAFARVRAAEAREANIEVIEAPVEDAALSHRADALLFCYTHDVLQNPRALVNLFAAAKPGARVAVAGVRHVTWWLAPVNLWTCWRARHYLSTFRGLSHPWTPLRAYCPDLTVVRTYHAGTSYLATGRTAGEKRLDA